MELAADTLPIEQVAKRWIVTSDPDEAVAKVADYIGYGLNHPVFHAPGHDQLRFCQWPTRSIRWWPDGGPTLCG
jgi:coenzyme F420-dependent glucose-6-phosphate dehydrogenase